MEDGRFGGAGDGRRGMREGGEQGGGEGGAADGNRGARAGGEGREQGGGEGGAANGIGIGIGNGIGNGNGGPAPAPSSSGPDDPDELLPLVYDELRRQAEVYLRRERAGHTLQPTALVHEAYLRLAGQDRVDWQGRTHFFAVGARIMRRLLIDHARGRGRVRRGGDRQRLTLDDEMAAIAGQDLDLLALHEAIEKLATLDPRQARIVELRFFAGLTVHEVAQELGVSKRTVEGDWTHARAWLRRELTSQTSTP